jgi:hypothetical protein
MSSSTTNSARVLAAFLRKLLSASNRLKRAACGSSVAGGEVEL